MSLAGAVIGYATMDSDRTIHLYLTASDGKGIRGEGMLSYTPRDPIYGQLLMHLGNLRPGKQMPYRAWPETELLA
jgi:hypothetical protein